MVLSKKLNWKVSKKAKKHFMKIGKFPDCGPISVAEELNKRFWLVLSKGIRQKIVAPLVSSKSS